MHTLKVVPSSWSVAAGVILAVILGVVLFGASFAAASSGAIFTTASSCDGVNVNIFDTKPDVYLDGGPHHVGSAGLPDGDYYVQVTNPSGSTVLGKTLTASVHVTSGNFDQCYQLVDILYSGTSGFTTKGYDDTTNGGGVYKVWASLNSTFDNGTNKTDNFKVKASVAQGGGTGSISGTKWEDLNANGVLDVAEEGLDNWTIEVWNSTHTTLIDSAATDSNGNYILSGLPAATYQVCEVLKTDWYPSYPTTSDPNCHSAVVVTDNTDTGSINFGNYQLASLTVIKHVVKDNGGSAAAGDFTMNVTGTNVSDASFPGDELGTTVTLKPGSYSVGESGGPTGYAQTLPDPNCSGTVTSGGSATCTITNDDIEPQLIVIKHVTNDNTGGKHASDFAITVTGSSPSPAAFPGAEAPGTTVLLNAGSYSVDEGAHVGYNKTLSADCSGTLVVGDVKTCTITNDDIPPTRTQGFWSTHTALTDAGWTTLVDPSVKTFCSGASRVVDASAATLANEVMGGFLSDIAKKTTGAQRSSIDKSRMALLQQLLAALLNKYVLNNNTGDTAIVTAKLAYCLGTQTQITASTGALDAFNNSGDNAPLSPSLIPGSATPATSQTQANKFFWNSTII